MIYELPIYDKKIIRPKIVYQILGTKARRTLANLQRVLVIRNKLDRQNFLLRGPLRCFRHSLQLNQV